MLCLDGRERNLYQTYQSQENRFVYNDKDMNEETRRTLLEKLTEISKGRSTGLGKKMEWELE